MRPLDMGIEPASSLEMWIVKWIVLPIVIVVVLIITYGHYREVLRCKDICKQRGYLKSEYISSNRVGIGAKCICTERIDSSGQVDKTAKIVIDLD